MILELKDEEILDFLMTSEFEENYKPEELKYLLHKFRYFHRVLHGKYELIKTDSQAENKKLKEMLENKEIEINQILTENASLKDNISSLKNRKLTLKERVSGKIINNNENK
jgi:hypothetical protein